MRADHRGECVSADLSQKFEAGDSGGGERALGQRLREDVGRADLRPIVGGRLRHPIAAVGDAAGEGDGAIAGNRPGRRRPDDDRSVVALDGERHVDRVARIILVFDLGFGERRLLDHAPHHGLRAAVEKAVGDEFEDFPCDLRLGGEAHRRIGMVPVADHAEPLEFRPLHVDPVLGVGAALPPERDDRLRIGKVRLGLALLAIELFLDLPLDRQAVAIPPRHVVRVLAGHLLSADDRVLQDLVQGGADVNIAVGVRRPIVQDELRPPLPAPSERAVEILPLPPGEDFGLLLRQAGSHRKIGFRQVQGSRVVEALDRCVSHGSEDRIEFAERKRGN